jgi:hypothetical protein
MPDVTIHRCTVRVVRRGGFGWGPDPGRLVESVKRALPALIARELQAQFPDEADAEIRPTLRVRVRARLADLTELASVSPAGASPAARAATTPLASALAQALRPLLTTAIEPTPRLPLAEQPAAVPAEEPPSPGASPAIRCLSRWYDAGSLATILRGFSLRALESWHRLLTAGVGSFDTRRAHAPGAPTPVPDDVASRETNTAGELRAICEALRASLGERAASRADVLRARLRAVVQACTQLSLAPGAPELNAAIDNVLPLPATEPARDSGESESSGVSAARHRAPSPIASPPATATSGVASVVASAAQGEVNVDCALPFLLVGALSQAGWIEALAALLNASDARGALPLAAVALAYKVLAAPDRGWQRTPAARRDAATFAGLAEPPPEPSLTALAEHTADLLSPLDAVLARAAAEGRTEGAPVVLARHAESGQLLLVEHDALSVVACGADLAALAAAIAAFEGALLLVPASAADPVLLRALHASGRVFVTDAPPTRGERWRNVSRRSARLFTNDDARSPSALHHAADDLGARADLALSGWREVLERRAAPLASAPDLDRSFAVAASVALGTLAFCLFHQRETPHPLLVLTRFGDLSARVRFEEHAVDVRLPLGRRTQDLADRGLLADVRAVPWLGGRTLRFPRG